MEKRDDYEETTRRPALPAAAGRVRPRARAHARLRPLGLRDGVVLLHRPGGLEGQGHHRPRRQEHPLHLLLLRRRAQALGRLYLFRPQRLRAGARGRGADGQGQPPGGSGDAGAALRGHDHRPHRLLRHRGGARLRVLRRRALHLQRQRALGLGLRFERRAGHPAGRLLRHLHPHRRGHRRQRRDPRPPAGGLAAGGGRLPPVHRGGRHLHLVPGGGHLHPGRLRAHQGRPLPGRRPGVYEGRRGLLHPDHAQ